MNMAFIGQKGTPARFGGIEVHVHQLARRLSECGHRVTVYVRSWSAPQGSTEHDGIHLQHTPSARTRHLDATDHGLTSSFHALAQDGDIIHCHALGPSAFARITRFFCFKVMVTVHALDWQKPKWNKEWGLNQDPRELGIAVLLPEL
jgi:glycosyltransferase involved in cell wall biosynthesis